MYASVLCARFVVPSGDSECIHHITTCTNSRKKRRSWATVCKTVRPMLSDRCLSVRQSVTLVFGQNGWTNQDAT